MASRLVRIPSSSQISAMNASFPNGDGEDVSSSSLRKCDCGLDAKLRTSTTVRNPGRRFYGCFNFVNGNVKGCGYFELVNSSSFEVAKDSDNQTPPILPLKALVPRVPVLWDHFSNQQSPSISKALPHCVFNFPDKKKSR
ncbi:hypothetical protein QYF36_014192 [Acer negundo]|nr:hypothetical protein QYF36_014192 [Acer negundo]